MLRLFFNANNGLFSGISDAAVELIPILAVGVSLVGDSAPITLFVPLLGNGFVALEAKIELFQVSPHVIGRMRAVTFALGAEHDVKHVRVLARYRA